MRDVILVLASATLPLAVLGLVQTIRSAYHTPRHGNPPR